VLFTGHRHVPNPTAVGTWNWEDTCLPIWALPASLRYVLLLQSVLSPLDLQHFLPSNLAPKFPERWGIQLGSSWGFLAS
jgi:hypothetical protein